VHEKSLFDNAKNAGAQSFLRVLRVLCGGKLAEAGLTLGVGRSLAGALETGLLAFLDASIAG